MPSSPSDAAGVPASTVTVEERADRVVLTVSGDFDLATTPTHAATFRTLSRSERHVILDLRGTRFVDSTGLAVLLNSARRAIAAGNHCVAVATPGAVLRVLELSGLVDTLHVQQDLDAAHALLDRAPAGPIAARRSPTRPVGRTCGMGLDEQRILITGATGALGTQLARELSARGAELALLGRDRGRLEELADELGGAPVACFEATRVGSCRPAVDALAAALGGLDGCMIAHGVAAFGDARELDDEIAEQLMAVNATSAIAVLRAAAAHIDGPGRLGAVTAVVAEYPTAGLAAYSASKAALSAYLTAVRRELRRDHISVLDARLPHLDTQFADHALAGTPPKLPEGLSAAEVAVTVVDAYESGAKELRWDLRARELAAA
ncbi:SDR family NAD(P)-dependent oxidoreductase [Conexibacter sp. W3-3-2]|uniref:SDR family NAD(P)-dependent oxidoreductase n=1 Tax=Conexibacter sp. W3-3-2 TaxID=2675227 RepID=UPI001E4A6299|nr:SDR family NAD(P)-dependent oxidoreductase [Conexibacter sp. W3-3-2]